MPGILLLLQTVRQNVHQISHSLDKKKFSEPKIYTGVVDITLWNELSKEEHKQALSKEYLLKNVFTSKKNNSLAS